jgi:hypothetical protein
MAMDGRKLRVGYILDDGDQSNAAFELFEKSRASQFYSIELLIVQKPAKGPRQNAVARALGYIKKRGLWKTLAKVGFAVIARAEKILFARSAKYAPYFKRHDLGKFQAEQLVVEPRVSKSGFVYRYSDADLEAIRSHDLDVLIRGGSGILRGGILTVCRFGIVSFHHANNKLNRGSPPGFWEVYHREPSTGFVIQKLSEELDGGDVLSRGAIATAHTYVVNAARLYLKANVFMHALLERIGRDGALPPPEPTQPYSKCGRADQLWLQDDRAHGCQSVAEAAGAFVSLGRRVSVRVELARCGVVALQSDQEPAASVLGRSVRRLARRASCCVR